jgi:hypothetical protein
MHVGGKLHQTVEIGVHLAIPANPMIELSGSAPLGQGHKHGSLFDNTRAATMNQKTRKHRSEAQRRHDTLLHESRCDRTAYNITSLEDMSTTVKEYRKAASALATHAECSEKALAST